MAIDRILRAFEATPWAIDPGKLSQIAAVLEAKANAGEIPTAGDIQAVERQQRSSGSREGAVAVIPLHGTISPRMGMLEAMSGGASLDAFAAQFDEAMADDAVGTIVLDIDSPGGSVYGVEEMAAKIFAARGRKRVIAVANHLMASAAYYLGSAADELVISPSGEVGSIGVYTVHFDESEAMEAAGVRATIVKAGAHKAEGNPFEPLEGEALEHMQSLVDDYYAQFVRAVARHRGRSVGAVEEGFGQGRTFTADRAVQAGLVDRVASMESVLSGLLGQTKTSRRRMRSAEQPALPMAASATVTGVSAWADITDAFNAVATSLDAVSTTPSFEIIAAAGHAEMEPDSAPTSQAPEAEEMTVDNGTTTAVQEGAATLEAERQRVNDLRAFAAETPEVTEKILGQWIASGSSLDDAKAAAFDLVRDAARAKPQVRVGTDREAAAPFTSFGEQIQAIMSAGMPSGSIDKRLLHHNEVYRNPFSAAATGASQGDPSSMGFIVAPQFSTAIWDGLNQQPDNLLAMVDSYPVEGESLTFPANAETSRATGSRYGGVQGYWLAEADQITASKPKLRQAKVEPQELGVLVYLTNKLLRNAPVALEQYVTKAATEEIGFLTSDSIIRGTGAGKPAGWLNSASLVTVAAEGSQAAATVLHQNISKMWQRLHPRSRGGAVWLANPDVEPELDNLFMPVQNVAGTENVGGRDQRLYNPEAGTLKGRPVIFTELCETLGTVGDLILVDPKGYLAGVRSGIDSEMSIHLRFDYAETALRFMFEVDGQPWLASALTPYKGSNTLSTHVALATRS